MANDKIMVTVRVPEGLRAVVKMADWDRARVSQHEQEQTVTGGQTMEFFVDGIRGLSIKEGFPHSITDALDRKPGEA